MRARLPWILFAISLVINLCVVAGFLYYKRADHRWNQSGSGSTVVFAASKLNLTTEQKARLDTMRQTLRKTQQESSAAVRPLRRALLEEINQPQPDFTKIDKLIDELSVRQAGAIKNAARAIDEFQKSLQPEQRAEFRRLIAQRAGERMMFGPTRQSEPRTRSGDGSKRAPASQ